MEIFAITHTHTFYGGSNTQNPLLGYATEQRITWLDFSLEMEYCNQSHYLRRMNNY